jgi:succinyl-CoA synthetase alpha subunit
MSVLVDAQTRVLVQGITGHQGTVHTRQMKEFGTQVVAGVTPGKAGTEVEGTPVFDSVREAVERTQANASCIFVPAPYAKDALIEAVDAGVRLCTMVTEHIPFHDMLTMYHYARANGTRIIGPNCPGIASPGPKAKVGIIPNVVFRPGRVGVISRSGTLTYEIVNGIREQGLGQSTCIGLGGDPVVGTSFVDALPLFQEDPDTDIVVLVGEIGGTAEEEAAEYIHHRFHKPVVAYIAGRASPPGKRMGHAGAIISRGRGTAESKQTALEAAGARVGRFPFEIPQLVTDTLKEAGRR